MKLVSLPDAKTRRSRQIEEAAEIIVARRGEAKARRVPLAPTAGPPGGRPRGILADGTSAIAPGACLGFARPDATVARVEAGRSQSRRHRAPFERMRTAQEISQDRPVVAAGRDRPRGAVERIG